MDIKRAKEEIVRTVSAYLDKDELGDYRISSIRQRPILLMGPPGVGKTQIMEQAARELSVGLVSYTITHHTRQSAVGLPFIKEKTYGDTVYSVTEYTMSEIIASVYEKMEKTGHREGILFLDEINCVSETLAPMMLQFLQGKTFGNQKLPDGWIVVAAGNPPEYNKSVRDFDVVTLDRLKRIDIEADFEVWREYAYSNMLHPAIISYLELKKDSFYRVETTVDGKLFVTARGWEDLSELMYVYEAKGYPVDRELVTQYLQHPMIAKDFANYVELYDKYRKDYRISDILKGRAQAESGRRLRNAAFDERLGVVSLLHAGVSEQFAACRQQDTYTEYLYEQLLYMKENLSRDVLDVTIRRAEEEMETRDRQEQWSRQTKLICAHVRDRLCEYRRHISGDAKEDAGEIFAQVKELFAQDVEKRETMIENAGEMLSRVFRFLSDTFGEGQEMVAFMTKLNADENSIWFVREHGSDEYYMHNKGLLFEERQADIAREMESVTDLLQGGLSGK